MKVLSRVSVSSAVSSSRYFVQENLFSIFVVLAIALLISASPVTFAAEKQSKTQSEAVEQAASVKKVDAIVNINRAGIPDLTTLVGIGEKKAIAIVKYRDANGKFKTIEQLTEVKGIGSKIIEKNRKRLVL